MKTRTTNETVEKQMKTIRTQAAQQEARGSFKRANSMFGNESPFSTDSRREVLMQLAAEGDENAVAELLIAYGTDLPPVAV